MIRIIQEDLLTANVAAICHQVNCKNVMGAGLAKTIANKYPEVKEEYNDLCVKAKENGGSESLLGRIQVVPIENYSKAVINIFGQLNYGRSGVHTNYNALAKAFKEINREFAGKSIGFPYGFGCGLGGGDWMTVEKLMLKYLWNCDVIICFKEDK